MSSLGYIQLNTKDIANCLYLFVHLKALTTPERFIIAALFLKCLGNSIARYSVDSWGKVSLFCPFPDVRTVAYIYCLEAMLIFSTKSIASLYSPHNFHKRTKMKSSYLTWLILAALPFGSDQHAAAGASLQENPVLQASETDPAFSLFDTEEGSDEEEEEEGFDEEEEDEMVSSSDTSHSQEFLCFVARALYDLAIVASLPVRCCRHVCFIPRIYRCPGEKMASHHARLIVSRAGLA
jgi:hypothetical protein